MRHLQQAGYQAVLAGGCVRDALLGRNPHDWDIATSARPEEVEALFKKTFPVGKQFGIILVLGENGTPYEVASFRGESTYSDGRHPDGIRYVGMQEDVKRRDFTVNALLYDPIASELLDFVGGESDMKNGILRAVGNPNERFQEDKLRMLRAIRFAANLGFRIDESSWQALCAQASSVPSCVSQERIRDEIGKMLINGASRKAFELLESSGLLEFILPELWAERGVEQPPQFHPEGDVWQHQLKMLSELDETIRRIDKTPPDAERFDDECRLQRASADEILWLSWGALLHDIGKPATFSRGADRIHFNGHDVLGAELATECLRRLRHSTETIDSAVYLVRHHMEAIQIPKARVARQRRHFQHSLCPLLLEIVRLDSLASFGGLELQKKLVELWRIEDAQPHPPKPMISGKDLLQRGLHTGPMLGAVLQKCNDYELEHPFANREEALIWLDESLRSGKLLN
ncbi:MAG: HD domain-containing protein [Lentisphaeria bacterium]|nr:HD domain-containing protein [Lentisphaeria bacterium]